MIVVEYINDLYIINHMEKRKKKEHQVTLVYKHTHEAIKQLSFKENLYIVEMYEKIVKFYKDNHSGAMDK